MFLILHTRIAKLRFAMAAVAVPIVAEAVLAASLAPVIPLVARGTVFAVASWKLIA